MAQAYTTACTRNVLVTRAGRASDWLQQFQLMNISVHSEKYANDPTIIYDGMYFILLQRY